MSTVPSFPDSIHRYLRGHVARLRRVRLVRAVLLAASVAIAWTLAVAALDRLLALPAWSRLVLLIALLGVVAFLLARPLRNLLAGAVDWVAASESVEQQVPELDQRLVTVTSQLLTPAPYRGSEQMLHSVLDEVTRQISSSRPPPARWHSLKQPGAILGILLLVAGILAWTPSMNLARLVARQWMPLAPIAPVTTTQITLTPGTVDVPEREPVTVRAHIRHLQGASPVILFTQNERDWEELAMTPSGDDAFTFTFAPAERDLRYRVKAGDARTDVHELRVLRRPAVADFQIRYTYPAYTGRGSLSVHNSDGLIEAPQGSEAMLSIVATEPLALAVIVIMGTRLEMAATGDPHVRQAQLSITKDQSYELEMVSTRGVSAKGPANLQIRAAPDRPPLVRLLQPATDLRLSPREIVPLMYQALDDYGLASLAVHVQVNARSPIEFPLRLRGADPRRVEGTFDLDLAPFELKVGDVVSIEFRATDKAAQKTRSDARHILISPRSVDIATHQRIGELATAAEFAATWADQLTRAQKLIDQTRKGSEIEQAAGASRVGRQLAAAGETALLLRQTLLRAIMHSSSPRMADLLAMWVDSVTTGIDNTSRVDEAIAATHRADDAAAARLGRLVTAARELAAQTRQLSEGEQAAAIQADRANLKAPTAPPATSPADRAALERRRVTLERVRAEINTSLAAIGINARDAAVEALVQQRVDAATRLLGAARPVDFVAATQRWSAAMRSNEKQPPQVDDRLAAAAQAEAVRPDAELVAARDLQLASRAAVALSDLSQGVSADQKKLRLEALDQFPRSLAALRAEHEVNRRMVRAQTPREARNINSASEAIRNAASQARARMITWASAGSATPDELAAKVREAEDLAMAANAHTFLHEFDKASEADRKLAATLGKPELATAGEAPRVIDRLSQAQESIADHPDPAAQEQVANEIASARAASDAGNDAVDSRQKATEAIGLAQERVAAMPLQLLNARDAALELAETSARLVEVRAKADRLPPDQRDSANGVVELVRAEQLDARKAYDQAVRNISATACDDLVNSLKPYIPESTTAVSAIDDQLRAALGAFEKALAESIQAQEPEVAEQSAESARGAIQQAQEALREAQARVIERDPLVSARWFARAAAEAMRTDQAGATRAASHQRSTLEALTRAGIDALRRSKNTRLSQVPSYAPFYLPPLAPWSDGEQRHAGDRLFQALPGLREWGRLRDRMGESAAAPIHESDPPGYSEALRTYFDVLSKEDKEPRR